MGDQDSPSLLGASKHFQAGLGNFRSLDIGADFLFEPENWGVPLGVPLNPQNQTVGFGEMRNPAGFLESLQQKAWGGGLFGLS